jgi:hypothetical protein
MSHSRNASDIGDLSETPSGPESVISFNENVYLIMQNAAVSTATYMGQARQTIEQLATNQYRWIATPPSVDDVDASRVLDAMLRNAHSTGGERSERYTACAICACSEIHEQVNLARTWFMYLLWPCKLKLRDVCQVHWCNFPLVVTAGTRQSSDLISSHAMTAIDDTYGSLISASPEWRSRFRIDVRPIFKNVALALTSNRLIDETVKDALFQVSGMEHTDPPVPIRVL